ncbi:expressed unknown protein [Seminavis robusta]|uniref:Uncharacterized protein n=1 Tax=Seminavis robusta TaxID=568900 RepID=A0A9N8H128_9STRA|nr:expressed unknown protein [Seminavis robusta]|eukprot:Sro32_g020680.1 n/a (113) ;mRNA; r:34645-34983
MRVSTLWILLAALLQTARAFTSTPLATKTKVLSPLRRQASIAENDEPFPEPQQEEAEEPQALEKRPSASSSRRPPSQKKLIDNDAVILAPVLALLLGFMALMGFAINMLFGG